MGIHTHIYSFCLPSRCETIERKMRFITSLAYGIVAGAAFAFADEEKDDRPIVGIDLGTTYSCVGIWDQKSQSVEIIPNDMGNRITPSYVAFSDEGRLVGDA